jgi:hypothetical protein
MMDSIWGGGFELNMLSALTRYVCGYPTMPV